MVVSRSPETEQNDKYNGWMDTTMYVWMDGWMEQQKERTIEQWMMYAWIDRWMDGTKEQTTEWMEQIEKIMDGWMGQWTGGWNKRTNIRMDEQIEQWMDGWNIITMNDGVWKEIIIR